MSSFEPGYLEGRSLDHRLLRTLRLLGEYRGKQSLWAQQSPQVLEVLREASVIESTESSNRIEGVTAPPQRLAELVRGDTAPRDRSEQEIAGYRDVLGTIHSNHAHMDFTPGVVLQLHRDLFRYDAARGGRWKSVDNEITEVRNGVRRLRFKPVPAFATAEAMRNLHERYARCLAEGNIDPLLLVSAYVLDFLCIHPFLDGNGRMARLLTLLLLYQNGYEVGRYISLERRVEDTREGYYETLYLASQGWHEHVHPIERWWEYSLGVMLVGAYQEFEARVGQVGARRGAKQQAVLDAFAHLPTHFRFSDIERACPGVSRPTIERVLQRLRAKGRAECVRAGRGALWEKRD